MALRVPPTAAEIESLASAEGNAMIPSLRAWDSWTVRMQVVLDWTVDPLSLGNCGNSFRLKSEVIN